MENQRQTKKEFADMKNVVVYYSMGGNTGYVAEKTADKLGADLIRLEPEKNYPDKGFKKFLWGGKSAVMGEEPLLKPYEFDESLYDRIIFGFPVWAGSFAPPIRSFISENRKSMLGKQFAAFACYAGSGADKALEKLKKFLGIAQLDAELVLIDPGDQRMPEKESKIQEFIDKLK